MILYCWQNIFLPVVFGVILIIYGLTQNRWMSLVICAQDPSQQNIGRRFFWQVLKIFFERLRKIKSTNWVLAGFVFYISNDPQCMCAYVHLGFSPCLYTGVIICGASVSYLQGFPLTVEQLGDVPCHSLHQVLGVVFLDFKLALLLIINLQMENIGNQRSGYWSH